MSHNVLGWVTFKMLFLLFIGSERLAVEGDHWQMHIHPDKPGVFYVEMNRQPRCGAMKSQPTQTYADNQNKHIAKLFCA